MINAVIVTMPATHAHWSICWAVGTAGILQLRSNSVGMSGRHSDNLSNGISRYTAVIASRLNAEGNCGARVKPASGSRDIQG